MAKTLFEKLWSDHEIQQLEDGDSLIYIDRVFLHERTGSVALESLSSDGRAVRTPGRVFCSMDHIVDTLPGRGDDTLVPAGKAFIQSTRQASRQAGIHLFDVNDFDQGIVHVISPELGIVQPGCTLVCPDSHTCSQGALGALAWGIGSSQAEHAMATNTLVVKKPRSMRVNFHGTLSPGVTAKDLILHLIARYGAAGGSGYAIEFAGEVIRNLDVEARLTLCNMAVEFSAFTAVIAPDQKTIDYLQGRRYAPSGDNWGAALDYWCSLHSDPGATFDREIDIDCSELAPCVTWGTSPQHACEITGKVPDIAPGAGDTDHATWRRAYEYMGVQAGQPLRSLAIDAAFIGSCTNSRISDLRQAAAVLSGRRVAEGVRAICVPGSQGVKRQAEAEGLDRIFMDAGFEWREPGCSMCFFAGGESFGFRQRIATSTNRNFEGRQGPESRSHLASPATVAASAIAGHLADPRDYLEGKPA
ncbi:3-isopropylmalate dehydratase large subunit [Microbulbifer bruguierae]|uniref:3-isopropylmalate dehydratase n=1 Tax=Microbulbifer bruguierae TaxID=3029061 RepID=A0ABY8NBI8_9GAMM|nr:3-isopropylmalate dehydratase large subunit [Microbulbifer bruguierae]WGL16291.1 3-isopropylmalate dehydratase large subunit [Microbulbifer bruguierae]